MPPTRHRSRADQPSGRGKRRLSAIKLGLGLSQVRKYVISAGTDQGQVGGQLVPLLGLGEALKS